MSQEFNVIEAKFSSRDRKCVIGPLWQYDYGQILRITGIDLPESYEVHFSNDPRGVAKSIPGNANGVRIPAEYLKSGSSVFAWLYVHQGEDDGSTEYQIEIQVRRRARPTSDAPDSEEKTAIGDLIEQMNVALSGAKEERAKAETAAENAEEAAQNVDTSVKLAQSYAVGGTGVREGEDQDNAKFWYERTAAAHNENIVDMEAKKDELVGELEQAAQENVGIVNQAAEERVNLILQKVSESETHEVNSRASAFNAAASEQGAQQAASAAGESEGKAKTSEEKAAASENAAKTSEENAKKSETAAGQSEQNAKDSENAAKDAETNAKQSEENAKNSENTVEQHKTDAEKAAGDSEDSAKLSESFAKGGTGVREGEDTDNSKFYSEQAKTSEENAKASEQAAADDRQAAESAKDTAEAAKLAAEEAKKDAEQAREDAIDAAKLIDIDPDKMGLEQDPDTGYVYPTYNGVRSENGIPLAATGGGTGPSSYEYTVSVKNLLDSTVVTIREGESAWLKVSYSSVDESGNGDGDGAGSILVDNVRVDRFVAVQGENEIDVAKYLTAGTHTVKIRVQNSEGTSRSAVYTVTLVSLSMTTTLNEMDRYSGDVVFYYTPVGSGDKTVYFLMDGEEIGTAVVSSSGRSQSFTIPAQSHGAHIFEAYAEMDYEGFTTTSNVIRLGMAWVETTSTDTIIVSTFNVEECTQGDVLTIPYMVFNPTSESAEAALEVVDADGEVYSTSHVTVGRIDQKWVVSNYPAGDVKFRISCGTAAFEKTVAVAESTLEVNPVTDGLAFCFDPTGRSNLEDNPDVWTDGTVEATFEGINFYNADGWMTDASGAPILRILPGGQMTVPFALFATDARTAGATVEVEMATHNVRDYDTIVMSCLSGTKGFKIASQYAKISSEQSELSMQFREDDKVRVSFVVEPRNLNRMMYVYVDGIMCGAIQYPDDDNFAQNPAVGITIGAESSGIDIYKIRMYTKGLTRQEILDNFIADRPLLADRIAAHTRNNIFGQSEDIVISQLPGSLAYMIIKCPELPQSKEDPDKTCEIEYVNLLEPARSFTATASIAVQGTSSAGYKKKNFKIKLTNGITYTASNTTAEKYMLREDSLPATVFCMKADVASSEGANNVELARLYNEIVPHKTPAQEADPRVRVGIDGLPCVIFWMNTDTNVTRFWGKYNFNFDKDAEVFGLTDGCESWEIRNNTSNRVLFKSADFSGTAWQDDFEARYPKKSTDCTRLKAMCEWVVSTDRSAVTSDEDKAARLQKFKDEFEQHFIKAPMLFYYLFTETFLMVDSRAKNFFPTTFDGVHWFPFPYDFDTAIGINNEGGLTFDYDLEDTDTVDGDVVFNGQDSVLWCNIRDAFPDELRDMYNTLRSTTGSIFNYTDVINRFAQHQAVWPEAIWNEDSWEKYLEPLEIDNDASYLTMLQGSKSSQREWWVFNGFRYRDSKYRCGDAEKNFITIRCYEVGDITVTPYSHIHPRIKFGSYTVTERGKRNVPTTLECPLDTMSDTEVYIYSADRLADIGDLSHLHVGYADFTDAVKLQKLKVGSGTEGYQNTRLTELYVGNNELLTELDVQNCIKLAMTVDLSGCINLETVKAKGSSATGFTLPVGGKVSRLELPATITNLTIRDQKQFDTLDMAGYGSVETLRLENTPNIPVEAIINGAENLNRVRLIGMEWVAESEATLYETIEKLTAESCNGIDANGSNTDKAVVTGRVYVPSISADLLNTINDAFPQLVVVANGVPQYIIRYLDVDNTVLYRAVVAEGGNAIDPVTAGYIEAPYIESTEDTKYTYLGFGDLPTNVHSNATVVAQFSITYRVRFMVEGSAYNTQWVAPGGSASLPAGTPTKASTYEYTYTFSHWSGDYTNVTGPVDITAVFTSTLRTYHTVYFYCGSTLLQTVTDVPFGGTATYTGTTPVDPSGAGLEFEGWSPSNTNIQGDTSCYAQFASATEVAEIADSWEEIMAAVADGTAGTKYKVGNYKPMDLGAEGIINMQIIGKNKDTLADGSGNATFTWLSKELLNTSKRMNPSYVELYDYKEQAATTSSNNNSSVSANSNKTTSFRSYIQAGEVAEITNTINATADGTLTITYKGLAASYGTLEVLVNGEAIVSDYASTTAVTYTVEMVSGDVVTVVAKFTSAQISSSSASVAFKSTGAFKLTTTSNNVVSRYVSGYQDATGAVGGWEKTEMRTYLKETIKPLMLEVVRNSIKEVTKTQTAYDTAGKSFTQTSIEDVWLPDYNEMFSSSSPYKAMFPDAASRVKSKVGATSASWWWLRSANTYNAFNSVYSNGYYDFNYANGSGGVTVGFCT